jgi:hypothetical protein
VLWTHGINGPGHAKKPLAPPKNAWLISEKLDLQIVRENFLLNCPELIHLERELSSG